MAKLAGLERKEAEHLLKCLVLHEERIAELEADMAEESAGSAETGCCGRFPGWGRKCRSHFLRTSARSVSRTHRR